MKIEYRFNLTASNMLTKVSPPTFPKPWRSSSFAGMFRNLPVGIKANRIFLKGAEKCLPGRKSATGESFWFFLVLAFFFGIDLLLPSGSQSWRVKCLNNFNQSPLSIHGAGSLAWENWKTQPNGIERRRFPRGEANKFCGRS